MNNFSKNAWARREILGVKKAKNTVAKRKKDTKKHRRKTIRSLHRLEKTKFSYRQVKVIVIFSKKAKNPLQKPFFRDKKLLFFRCAISTFFQSLRARRY